MNAQMPNGVPMAHPASEEIFRVLTESIRIVTSDYSTGNVVIQAYDYMVSLFCPESPNVILVRIIKALEQSKHNLCLIPFKNLYVGHFANYVQSKNTFLSICALKAINYMASIVDEDSPVLMYVVDAYINGNTEQSEAAKDAIISLSHIYNIHKIVFSFIPPPDIFQLLPYFTSNPDSVARTVALVEQHLHSNDWKIPLDSSARLIENLRAVPNKLFKILCQTMNSELFPHIITIFETAKNFLISSQKIQLGSFLIEKVRTIDNQVYVCSSLKLLSGLCVVTDKLNDFTPPSPLAAVYYIRVLNRSEETGSRIKRVLTITSPISDHLFKKLIKSLKPHCCHFSEEDHLYLAQQLFQNISKKAPKLQDVASEYLLLVPPDVAFIYAFEGIENETLTTKLKSAFIRIYELAGFSTQIPVRREEALYAASLMFSCQRFSHAASLLDYPDLSFKELAFYQLSKAEDLFMSGIFSEAVAFYVKSSSSFLVADSHLKFHSLYAEAKAVYSIVLMQANLLKSFPPPDSIDDYLPQLRLLVTHVQSLTKSSISLIENKWQTSRDIVNQFENVVTEMVNCIANGTVPDPVYLTSPPLLAYHVPPIEVVELSQPWIQFVPVPDQQICLNAEVKGKVINRFNKNITLRVQVNTVIGLEKMNVADEVISNDGQFTILFPFEPPKKIISSVLVQMEFNFAAEPEGSRERYYVVSLTRYAYVNELTGTL